MLETINLYANSVSGDVQTSVIERLTEVESDINALQGSTSLLTAEVEGARGGLSNVDARLDGIDTSLQNLVYDVKKYGATGLGVVDETIAVNACITAAPEGSTVLFPNGTYKIDSEIIVTKSLVFDFNGSVLVCSGTNGITFTGALKATKTVTVDYTEVSGKNSLTLDSATDVAVGDIINVISTELYDTSRLYYYNGGNAVITKIVGNVVYFNLTFPFDMLAASITVKIYDPCEPIVKNIKLFDCGLTLINSNFGLNFEYCKNVKIENVNTDGFQRNIQITRSVNISLDNINTGHAKDTESDSWDGYGIALSSCTNVRGHNVVTNSGQHGLTWGGQEVNYGLYFDTCIFKAESTNQGLGNHENLWDITLINCKIFGFSLSNNVHMINCDILPCELTNKSLTLFPAESYRNCNYVFDGCRFVGQTVALMDYYQVACPTRKYVGNIIFRNCSDFKLSVKVNNQSSGAKVADVQNIVLDTCREFAISLYDIVDTLTVKNCSAKSDVNAIAQLAVSATYQNINRVIIENILLPKRYDSILIMLAGYVSVKNFHYNATDFGTDQQTYANVGNLHLEQYDNSAAQTGIILTAVTMLTMVNCNVKFKTALATQLANATRVEAKGILVGAEYMDIITGTDGYRYKVQAVGNASPAWALAKII